MSPWLCLTEKVTVKKKVSIFCLDYLKVAIFNFAVLRIREVICGGCQHVILGKQLPQLPDLVPIDTAVGHAHSVHLQIGTLICKFCLISVLEA